MKHSPVVITEPAAVAALREIYQNNGLGAAYDLGEGVEENKAEAAKWYRRAAEQGHAEAKRDLGGLKGGRR